MLRGSSSGLGPKLVVVLNGGVPGIAAALVEDGHHAYVACGSDVRFGSQRDATASPMAPHVDP